MIAENRPSPIAILDDKGNSLQTQAVTREQGKGFMFSPTVLRQVMSTWPSIQRIAAVPYPCHCRFVSTTASLNARSHYQTLGISNGATQADIKNAYYRLSMKYHPDKRRGQDEKFKEITVAYEVLGNPRLRKLYDRGILSDEDPDPSVHDDTPSDPETMAEQSDRIRQTVKSFDQWSQTQATQAFKRRQKAKQTVDMQERSDPQRTGDAGGEKLIVILMLVIVIGFSGSQLFTSTWNKKDINDKDKKTKS